MKYNQGVVSRFYSANEQKKNEVDGLRQNNQNLMMKKDLTMEGTLFYSSENITSAS